ncbi:hypothetical protein STEG23_024904 [Scotinomys teguina]
MARKVGQWEEEDVAQSQEEEDRCQPARKRRCRVTGYVNMYILMIGCSSLSEFFYKINHPNNKTLGCPPEINDNLGPQTHLRQINCKEILHNEKEPASNSAKMERPYSEDKFPKTRTSSAVNCEELVNGSSMIKNLIVMIITGALFSSHEFSFVFTSND